MKSVVHEYTGAFLSFIGCICLFGVFPVLFMGEKGFFAVIIKAVLQGGF